MKAAALDSNLHEISCFKEKWSDTVTCLASYFTNLLVSALLPFLHSQFGPF